MKKAVLGTVVSLQGPIHCVGGGMAEGAAGAAMVDVRQVWRRQPASLQGELELAGEVAVVDRAWMDQLQSIVVMLRVPGAVGGVP